MKRILNIMSVAGSFMVVFAALFFLQNLLFGSIKILRDLTILNISFKDLLFSSTSILFIWKFVVFYRPARHALRKSKSLGSV